MSPRRTQSAPERQDTTAEAVDRLAEQVNLVWQSLDEFRDDFQWAVRNAQDTPELSRPVRVTSMALDPCDPDWGNKLNALRPEDLPTESAPAPRPASVIVDGEQLEQALDRLSPPGPDGQRAERIEVTAKSFAEAMEDVDQLVYCCTEPQLAWEGDPDAPSVICRGCGFVVAEYGNIVDERVARRDGSGDGDPNEPPSLGPTQGRLWTDAEG